MKICLIGGIYNKGGGRSNYVKITPETTLESGFRSAGHDVTTLSHYDEMNFSGFDVVHVHHLSYGALRMASDGSAAPFIFTPHSTTHLSGATMSRARRLAMRYVLSHADAVVGLTKTESAATRRAFGLDRTVVATIPNGIDVSQYSYRRTNRAGKGAPWQLIFVGQLIPLKRCDILLQAVASLSQDVRLTLAYQNPQLESELMSLAASLGLREKVLFRGDTGPAELAGLYQNSDLLILPSETEALPSVITEAMLCGLPFVASDVGGIREQADRFGLVLGNRSAESFASAIGEVLADYGKFEDAGAAMSEYAKSTFAIDAMVAKHLELYQQVRSVQPRRRAARFTFQHAIASAAARWMGTSGPGSPANTSATKVA